MTLARHTRTRPSDTSSRARGTRSFRFRFRYDTAVVRHLEASYDTGPPIPVMGDGEAQRATSIFVCYSRPFRFGVWCTTVLHHSQTGGGYIQPLGCVIFKERATLNT